MQFVWVFFLLRNQINTENVVKLKQKFSSLCCLQSLHVAGSPAKEEEEVDRILNFFFMLFFYYYWILLSNYSARANVNKNFHTFTSHLHLLAEHRLGPSGLRAHLPAGGSERPAGRVPRHPVGPPVRRNQLLGRPGERRPAAELPGAFERRQPAEGQSQQVT